MSYQALADSEALALPVRSRSRVSETFRLSALPLHHSLAPAKGLLMVVVTAFFGRSTTSACGSALLYSTGPMWWVDSVPALALSNFSQPSLSLLQASRSFGMSPIEFLPSPSQEPDDISDQKPTELSMPLPEVS